MPLEGLANMGFTGMPSVRWQAEASVLPSWPSKRAFVMSSKFGTSQKACRTASCMDCSWPSNSAKEGDLGSFRTSPAAAAPSRAGTVSTKAWARASSIVGIRMPMRSLDCSMRTMYLASSPCDATSIFLILSFFSLPQSLPAAAAMDFISPKTCAIMSFGGLPSIFCEARLCNATSPKSLASPAVMALLICACDLPNVSAIALMSVLSPIPSSDCS
mmetsp:Transcript_6017/g.14357  ORF Transcript_6017/g.14357 Transcript_6017/m.14357 type:complete len:216 (+) Transcript_6017:1183-1830(+)